MNQKSNIRLVTVAIRIDTWIFGWYFGPINSVAFTDASRCFSLSLHSVLMLLVYSLSWCVASRAIDRPNRTVRTKTRIHVRKLHLEQCKNYYDSKHIESSLYIRMSLCVYWFVVVVVVVFSFESHGIGSAWVHVSLIMISIIQCFPDGKCVIRKGIIVLPFLISGVFPTQNWWRINFRTFLPLHVCLFHLSLCITHSLTHSLIFFTISIYRIHENQY